MVKFGRVYLGVALVAIGTVTQANAEMVLGSSGTYTDNGSGWTQSETVLYPPSTFPDILQKMTATLSGSSQDLTGTFFYTSNDGSSTLLLDVDITSTVSGPQSFSAIGTWSFASGTGQYYGFAGDTHDGDYSGGAGTFTINQNVGYPLTTGISTTIVSGELVTPEPVSVSLLAFGVLGLARRKRTNR